MTRYLRFYFSALWFAALLLATGAQALAQTAAPSGEVFEDPEGKYVLTLPAGWLAIVNEDGLGRKEVNIVYRVRENGALKVRRVDDVAAIEVMDYAAKDEGERVRFNPGYDKIALEKFLLGGSKNGALLAYDYKNTAGQPFTGRIYYLRADDKTIYVLQFTGRKNTLGVLRSQTDTIARSFKAK